MDSLQKQKELAIFKEQSKYTQLQHQHFFQMNDSVVDLQPICSSQQQEEVSQLQIKRVPSSTIPKSQSIKQYMFNLKYNIIHNSFVPIPYFHRPKITLSDESEPAWLMGTMFEHPNYDKFLHSFRQIIWMSYRANAAGKGDAGWGCMIRVVQMVFAEIIKRCNPTVSLNDVIGLFKQGKNHIFSLQNICNEGKIKQRWTGSNEILLSMTSILNNCKNEQKQNNINNAIPLPSNIKLNFNIQLYCEQITLQNLENIANENEKQFPKVVVISSKLVEEGSNYFPQIYAAHAKSLMKMPAFCGMVGGVSGQALFITGFQDDKVIILDPHYVQQQQQSQKIRYFKKTPRGLAFTELCQSVSFCFYFANVDQYRNWAGNVCYYYKIYAPYCVIDLEVESPEDMIEKYRKASDQFQIL